MSEQIPKEQIATCGEHKRVPFPSDGQENWHVPCPFCLVDALREIANGKGYYGAQAREYKQIAIAALLKTGAGL